MNKKIYIAFFLIFLVSNLVCAQEYATKSQQKDFTIKVSIVDKETNKAIKNAEVSVDARIYSFPNVNEKYVVKAKIGDELMVSHPDFETVFYTIKSKDDIKIYVAEENKKELSSKRKSDYSSLSIRKISKEKKIDNFKYYLDSAQFYKKIDIDKSISFLASNFSNNASSQRTATSYATLADVYLYWKQYDLAVDNYKLSLQLNDKVDTRIALAKTQILTKEFAESERNFKKVRSKKLTNYQEIIANQGLGEAYLLQKKYKKAKASFTTALQIAKENLVTPKITDLNSKLAEVYALEGNQEQANKYYQNSLELASKENVQRSLKEQDKVADFYNLSNRYDDEIELRQETLVDAEAIASDSVFTSIKDTINAQKINYKIGNAYVLKEDYGKAISYFEESIKKANEKEDLVVKKDATRKLSEVYRTVGDYTKALKSYEDYVKLVDEDYAKKQQEIQQVKRFSKKISDNQNRIVSLEKDKELTNSKISLAYKEQQLIQENNKRQRYIIYSLIAGFLLMSLLTYLLYRNSKQQKLANNLLALKSMRSQMNPHFIFNALNSVNSFIAVNDERNANRYLSEFSVLMRSVLENSDEDFIPLSKEIELLELYVKLEHNRFKDKFEYSISVAKDIDIDQFSIPPMLLQPYIENAIWHGLRYKEEKGKLAIEIQQQDTDTLLIMVKDDGVGRAKSAALKTKNQLKQKSKGMSTIKERIAILNDMYKDRVSVVIKDALATGEGTIVALLLKKK